MWLSRYFVWFMFYSFLGWVFETIYCTLDEGKWDNRGFLYGPICPIYGVGALGITMLAEISNLKGLEARPWWQVFLIMFFGSMILEYSTSVVLEKLFHAVWWDYSNLPLNIHGRICFPASCLFGIGGLLITYKIYPWISSLTINVHPVWMELVSLILMAIGAGDLTLTVSALKNFDKMVQSMDETLNAHMDTLVNGLEAKRAGASAILLEKRAEAGAAILERGAEAKAAGAAIIEKGAEARAAIIEKGAEAGAAFRDKATGAGATFLRNRLPGPDNMTLMDYMNVSYRDEGVYIKEQIAEEPAAEEQRKTEKTAEQYMLEERERFSNENMERYISGMSNSSRKALKRVVGYRPKGNDARKEQGQRFLSAVKNHLKKNGKGAK